MNQKDIGGERGSEPHNFGDAYSRTKFEQDSSLQEHRQHKRGLERAGTMGSVPSRVTMPKNQGPGVSRQFVPSDHATASLKSPKMSGTHSQE